MTRPGRVDIASDRLLELVRDGLTNAQIAAQFGCTVRTIDRRRAADPDLSREIIRVRAELAALNAPDHGTIQCYRHGCHCRACTSANTIRCREGNLARRARRGLPAPDPNRGRRRSVASAARLGTISNPSRDTLIAQAIARGESTSAIMQRLSCLYEDVAAVRDSLDELVVA